MNAPPPSVRFDAVESAEYRSYRRFVNAARNWDVEKGYVELHNAFQREADAEGVTPKSADEALAILDRLDLFRIYAFLFRNIQRLKYAGHGYGIMPYVLEQQDTLLPQIEAIAAEGVAKGVLHLDASVPVPDYFKLVDFHQHPGGVDGNPLAGLQYELARRTRTHSRVFANQLYRDIFSYLPKGQAFDRVLDWGTSFGAGLRTWLHDNPNSEGHGVDISAPCLKLAYARAREQGIEANWWQQDLEHLGFPDNHFDMSFFAYMLHELPPGRTPALLKEVHRVLKPGGFFIGMELVYVDGSPFQNAIADLEGWLNDEPFMASCFNTDYAMVGRKAGFSEVMITRFTEMADGAMPEDKRIPPRSTWNIFRFQK